MLKTDVMSLPGEPNIYSRDDDHKQVDGITLLAFAAGIW